MPDAAHWVTWKEKCALALCLPAVQSDLRAFVHSRSRRYAAIYAQSFRVTEAEAASSGPGDTWHWFETYFQLHSSREGKSYKEWLFARAAMRPSVGAGNIESGVSLLLRDVVRDRLRHEYSPGRAVSPDAATSPVDDNAQLSPADLLPDSFDTVGEVERREVERIASQLAESALAAIPLRGRIALLGRELGISLAHPAILKAARCGKTVLANAHRAALVAGLITRI